MYKAPLSVTGLAKITSWDNDKVLTREQEEYYFGVGRMYVY